MLGSAFSEAPISFINTVPGKAGVAIAYLAEAAMAGGLMLMVLTVLSWERLSPHVGYFAGVMVAAYIACFAPVSGMSINPARTFASAAPANDLRYFWLYFTAPVLGMIGAVELFNLAKLGRGWFCAKLNHDNRYRCIHCGYEPQKAMHSVHSDHPG